MFYWVESCPRRASRSSPCAVLDGLFFPHVHKHAHKSRVGSRNLVIELRERHWKGQLQQPGGSHS